MMPKPGKNLLIVTVVFTALFIAAVVVLNVVHPLRQVIETVPAFDVSTAEETLRGLEPKDRASYLLFERLDFGFMAIYALTFGFATVTVANWKEWQPSGLRRWGGLAVAVPAVVCDVVENVTMQSLISEPSRAGLNVAWGWSVAKFALFAVAFLVPAVWAGHRLLNKTRTAYKNGMRVERTYFSLRLALSSLMAVLVIALLIHAVATHCVRQSISAYYYTPMLPMFVGTLIAVGTCLIAYQGTTYIENILLDIAGFFAFMVAFVPTSPTDKSCQASIVQSTIDESVITPLDFVHFNVYPLLWITIAATAMALVARAKSKKDDGKKPELIRIGAGLGAQVFIIAFIWLLPDGFKSVAHWFAATGLFVCIIAVVWSNHLGRSETRAGDGWWSRNIYAMVIAFMGLILVVTAVMLVTDWAYRVTFVEFGLVVGFAVFWGIQTADLKTYANREEKHANEPAEPGEQ